MTELILEHAAPLIDAGAGWLDARASLARAQGFAVACAGVVGVIAGATVAYVAYRIHRPRSS